MRKERKHYSGEEKVAILRRYLVDKVPVSDLCEELGLRPSLREIRTTSYLLHPPLLDEAGFASAARWFVEGFSKRSNIEVECDISRQSERLSGECELVLFRVLQESLTNVHRHSGASAARIRLAMNQGPTRTPGQR
jgi:signal transduction histidine kinase